MNLKSTKLAIFFGAVSCLMITDIFAQQTKIKQTNATIIGYSKNTGLPNFIELDPNQNVSDKDFMNWAKASLDIPDGVSFKAYDIQKDELGFTTTRYKEFVGSTPVEGTMLITHSKEGKIISVNGDYYNRFDAPRSAGIPEKTALLNALKYVNAQKYKWENKEETGAMRESLHQPDFTYYPKGELVLVHKLKADFSVVNIRLAYKFNIYAEQPLSRSYIFVDALTGVVISKEEIIKTADVTGTATTKFSGTQTITSDNYATGQYRLRETGRGNGIQTYNLSNSSTYTNTDFTNTSATWNITGTNQAATDAHFGAEKTYDYYMNIHTRNSIDNAGLLLKSYVHYSTNYVNAFWDGQRMTYGDGNVSQGFLIMTALDVCGHEITHGLTQYTAGLNGGGSGEADALNEGFSDIFGTSIEWYARPAQHDWIMGADITCNSSGTPNGVGIRNMSNPGAFSQPNTYLGTNWDNAGEPHNNDGPAIYWYYLLCQGGSGTNTIGSAYNVTGITMAKAEKIAFRGLTTYFTPSTSYANARTYTIKAATDLYGACSPEVIATTNAWYAVGVGAAFQTSACASSAGVAIALTAGTNPACPGTSVTFTATPTNGGSAPSYQWQVNGANVGTNSATYTTTTLTNGQVVKCIMTSNMAGVTNNPGTSNAITMTIGNLTPTITIAGNSSACAGATITFTSSVTNGGTAPAYQWKVNGVNAGTNSATFTSSSLTNGQSVTCVLTSNATCLSTNTATSNSITMTMSSAVSLPFSENFEGTTFPPTGWTLGNADAPSIAWGTTGAKGLERRAAAGNTGSATGCAGIECFNYSSDTTQVDNLISKAVSLSGVTNAKLTFKRAYKTYISTTNPNNYRDELKVYVSTDCGATYGSALYFKKGAQLASNGSINTTFSPAVAADWKTDTISLAAYSGQSVIVKFEVQNRWGNNLYIDDINITASAPAAVASVAISETSGTNPACSGSSVTFTAAPTNGGTAPSYQWKVNGTNAGTNSATFTTSSLTNGQAVTCVMTSNLSGVAASPATSNAVTMTITPSVTPAISISANQTGAICAGTPVTFTATPANGGTTPAYQWMVNGVNAGTNSAALTKTNLANGDVVTCVLTSNATCATATTATSSGITMTVNPSVTPAVSATTSQTGAMCAGTSVTFTAAPTNGGATPGYQWNVNGTNAGTNNATFTSTSLANGDVVTCVLTSNAACATSTTATSSGITMTVNPSVTPAVSASTSQTGAICAGTSVTFTATPTNGGTTPGYQWNVNGVNTGTNNATFTSASLANGDVVTCVLTSNVACATSTTATSFGITMIVNPSVTPAVSASADQTGAICAGTSVTFTAAPTNGGNTPFYQWNVNGVNAGTNSVTFTSASLADGDVITCVLTSNAACASTTTATSSGLTMAVNAIPPAPVITQNGLVLTSSAASGNQWYLNGNIIAGATGQTYTATQNGNYTVEVTGNGCSSVASSPASVSTTGIADAAGSTVSFNVYPNPSNGQFTVLFEITEKADYLIELRNELGQIIYKETLSNYSGTFSKNIDILGYGKGIYMMSLTSSAYISIKKVIVY